MRTIDLQRKFGLTLEELEAWRRAMGGTFGFQFGHLVKPRGGGLLVREHTSDLIRVPNIVVNEGLDKLLDVMLNNVTPINPWYLTAFVDNVTPLATHTAAVPGVDEIDAADVAEAVRETYNPNAASGQSIDNVGTVQTYTADQTFTMFGAMLIGGGTSAFQNTAGTLWASGLLSPSRSLVALDTVDLTYTNTSADDGV